MNTADRLDSQTASLEADISRTRASLDRKINELERRFSPRERLAQVRDRMDPRPYVGWAAVAAVAAGTWMAVSGARRHLAGRHESAPYDPADMLGE